MKNQYFGDINDFRKYGLLRTLQRTSGLTVGVCWSLTNDDGGSDGELREYLNQPKRWRHYDPELYDRLQRLLGPDVARSVVLAREWDLVPGASFFEASLCDDRSARTAYFEGARRALAACDLVFLDPDIGIEVPSTRLGASGCSHYVYWSELKALYTGSQSLLVYQHYPRVVRERFVPFLGARLREELPGSSVVAFSTAHVVFFLVYHSKHADALEKAARTVQRQWSGQIDLNAWPEAATARPNPEAVAAATNVSPVAHGGAFRSLAVERRRGPRSAVASIPEAGAWRQPMANSRCKHGIDQRFCSICSRERPRTGGAVGGATLSEILRFLNHAKIRATYGAVAELLGVIPRQMGALLGTRRPTASWVVSAKDWCPTDYQPGEMHPDLFHKSEVIESGTELGKRIIAWKREQLC